MDGKTEVRMGDKATTVAKSYKGKEIVESHNRFEGRRHIKQEIISISLSRTREVYRIIINYNVVVILT